MIVVTTFKVISVPHVRSFSQFGKNITFLVNKDLFLSTIESLIFHKVINIKVFNTNTSYKTARIIIS